ncbi:hypothetical protein SS1G_10724 [Sclerotinia sclerotiorum 1980 UF-70]|uniref:Uncharacterized protein n=1 Tax=Sclerotinia sclerotiorum (strain ATCC 18683 / 1980 / Ss-1) TaxID=665079 RepID=A7EZF7_SCLS1|nr:hypothetical protein SS1G_10724 [Sclerotinia sclerotiorum 1980 UF-70]EDN94849.1 hypothetical protein SS1G_10724 [Sclerotinia sclerotiorum 1980 UF-70]
MAPITKECDFLVIGGGSGGLATARKASGVYGVKTIAVEAKRLGGTCVNVGCVPKKVTFNAAAIAEAIHDSKAYGFSVETTAPFNWSYFKNKRDAFIKRLNGIYERNLGNDKVEYIHGWASLTGKNEAEVTLDDGTKQTIRAKKILLAVGGRPTVPQGIPGADFDPMVQETVTNEYERLGVKLHKNSVQTKIEKDEKTGKLTIHYEDSNGKSTLEDVDDLIWAIGRSPEVDGLGLDKAGVKQNERGQIIADEYQNTNVDSIYSLGDVIGKIELTPVAIAAGLGSIGLIELEAIERYGKENIKCYNTSFTALYYTMMEPEDKGPTKYKLVCLGPEEKVIGLHILGLGSGEMLQGFGVAVKMGATKKDFDSCVAIHPTSAEELVTMK